MIFTSGYTPDAVPFVSAIDPGSLVLQKPYTLRSLSQTIRTALDTPQPPTARPHPIS